MNQKLRDKHDLLLARPKKYRITPKYYPPDNNSVNILYKRIKRPVFPLNNRRLEMLAVPVKYTPKYEPLEEPSTCVSRAVLEAVCTPRLDHLSRPTVRVLEAIKKERTHYGKTYVDMINDRIAMSLDTIYYHNIKSLKAIEASKKKSSKSVKTVRPKYWDEVGDKERLAYLALPKAGAKPRPPRRRKRMKLADLRPRLERLALPLPTHIYKRPSQDSLVLRLRVKPSALNYQITDYIKKLTEPFAWKLVKPYVPQGVKRSALTYEITDRIKQLSVPHPRAHAIESDLKENPYDINPYALTYKATPRIIELAKPIER